MDEANVDQAALGPGQIISTPILFFSFPRFPGELSFSDAALPDDPRDGELWEVTATFAARRSSHERFTVSVIFGTSQYTEESAYLTYCHFRTQDSVIEISTTQHFLFELTKSIDKE